MIAAAINLMCGIGALLIALHTGSIVSLMAGIVCCLWAGLIAGVESEL